MHIIRNILQVIIVTQIFVYQKSPRGELTLRDTSLCQLTYRSTQVKKSREVIQAQLEYIVIWLIFTPLSVTFRWVCCVSNIYFGTCFPKAGCDISMGV